MNEKLVSIIIPIYNTEQFIKECIESVLVQTYGTFELLLIDNGSEDKSGLICDKYKEKDSRITVIHKQHGSISSARNVGLEIARGNYVTFVDSDDFLPNTALEVLVAKAVSSNADIIVGNAQSLYIDCTIPVIETDEIAVLDRTATMIEWQCNHRFGSEVWGKLYQRAVVNALRFPEQRCEDVVFLFEAIKRSNIVVLLNKNVYFYRMHRLYKDRSSYRRPVEDEKVDALVAILDYILEFDSSNYDKFFAAETKSIFSSVLRIYAAHKEKLQYVYLENARKFFCTYWSRIKNEKSIPLKQRILIKLFCKHTWLFSAAFCIRNTIKAKFGG